MGREGLHRRITLLLTATVTPAGGAPLVAVMDPATRLSEYERALSFYCSHSAFDHVVFCENSGSGLSRLRQTRPGVEFLSYVADPETSSRGKGYGELGIIEHALENSDRVGTSDLLVKISGRYLVRNVARLAGSLRNVPGLDVIVDLRCGLSMADTRICAFSPEFARRFLLSQRERVDDRVGYLMEHAFARATHLAVADGATWRPWQYEPDIVGVSGTGGSPYPRTVLHRAYRAALRRIQRLALER